MTMTPAVFVFVCQACSTSRRTLHAHVLQERTHVPRRYKILDSAKIFNIGDEHVCARRQSIHHRARRHIFHENDHGVGRLEPGATAAVFV
jgi:hypothetical protein